MTSRLPFGEELGAELGSPSRADLLDSSPRSRVWRVDLPGTPVVVKQLVDGPEADERYAREVAALRLASRVDPPVVPRLLGTDPGQRVLVIEHLEHRPPADDWVVDYAETLARLHAATSEDAADVLPAWSGPTARPGITRRARTSRATSPTPAPAGCCAATHWSSAPTEARPTTWPRSRPVTDTGALQPPANAWSTASASSAGWPQTAPS